MSKQSFYELLLSKKDLRLGTTRAVILKCHPKALPKLKAILGDRFTSPDLYHFLQPNARTTCVECGKPVKFKTIYIGYARYCCQKCNHNSDETKHKKILGCRASMGVDNPGQSPKVRTKVLESVRSNLGVDFPMQSKKVKAKAVRTRVRKTGYEYTTQLPEFRAMRDATMLARWGATDAMQVPELKEKARLTTQSNFGVDNASQSPIIKQQKIETSRINFGTDYPVQNPEVFAKMQAALHKLKDVTVKGKSFQLQGYEPQALKYFVQNKVPVKNIEQTHFSVPYWCSLSLRDRAYYPDFLITCEGRVTCVEVKSVYTAALDETSGLFGINIQDKRDGVRALGYEYILVVMNKDGTYNSHATMYDKVCSKDEAYFKEHLFSLAHNWLV